MGTIELTLTHLKRIWFIAFRRNVRVGFSFANNAMLICSRNLNIKLKDFFEWAEKNQTLYFSEMLYAAHLAYCQEHYTKPKLSKNDILVGFSELDEEKQKELMKVWQEAESFGVKDSGKKKMKD